MATRKTQFYPYLIYYRPSFITLIGLAYIGSYSIFIISSSASSEFAITLVFPLLFFSLVLLLVALNNTILRKRLGVLTEAGYFNGSIPTHVICQFVDEVRSAAGHDDKLRNLFTEIFTPGLSQERLRDLAALDGSPEKLLVKLMELNKTHELDRMIKHYSHEFRK